MNAFCTIFDKNYLLQAITLYRSLEQFNTNSDFYALCMDEESFALLSIMNLRGMIPVSVKDLLYPELEQVRAKTTLGQFCWVCQPVFCEYILNKFKPEMVIYLEADSYFFSDPKILIDELCDDSVSLVPHNFSPEFDHTNNAGKYCVQFNAFRNNTDGHSVLKYWKDNCFTYSRDKPLYYPGQICLDNWENFFHGVKIIGNIGAGVAPWNIGKFNLEIKNGIPYVDGSPIVFYHYHQYGRMQDGGHELGIYPLSKLAVDTIYGIYVRKQREAEQLIRLQDPLFNFRKTYPRVDIIASFFSGRFSTAAKQFLIFFKRKVKRRYNIFPDAYFDEFKQTLKV